MVVVMNVDDEAMDGTGTGNALPRFSQLVIGERATPALQQLYIR